MVGIPSILVILFITASLFGLRIVAPLVFLANLVSLIILVSLISLVAPVSLAMLIALVSQSRGLVMLACLPNMDRLTSLTRTTRPTWRIRWVGIYIMTLTPN